ncbi:unnamed protein product [Rhizophagus irregularis]|nr:unnamed protein product [Rhizophagus irregularis]
MNAWNNGIGFFILGSWIGLPDIHSARDNQTHSAETFDDWAGAQAKKPVFGHNYHLHQGGLILVSMQFLYAFIRFLL